MYCTFCGENNADTNKFCQECGKPLIKPTGTPVGQGQPSPPTYQASPGLSQGAGSLLNINLSGKENMKRIATVGAVLVLVCFFLPWLMVSCSLYTQEGLEVSGMDMVTAAADAGSLESAFTYSYGQSSMDPGTAVFIIGLLVVPVFAAISLFLIYSTNIGAARFFTVVALISLVLLSLLFLDTKSSSGQDGFYIRFRIGFYGTWLGMVLLNYGIFQIPAIKNVLPRSPGRY